MLYKYIPKTISAVTIFTFLSGCEVPVMLAADANDGQMVGAFTLEFPAMMIAQVEDEFEEVLVGKLRGHMNGNADYTLSGPTWGDCTGRYEGTVNTMSCSNGFSHSQEVGKQRAKMFGVNVEPGTYDGVPFIVGFGWGNNANEADIRTELVAAKN